MLFLLKNGFLFLLSKIDFLYYFCSKLRLPLIFAYNYPFHILFFFKINFLSKFFLNPNFHLFLLKIDYPANFGLKWDIFVYFLLQKPKMILFWNIRLAFTLFLVYPQNYHFYLFLPKINNRFSLTIFPRNQYSEYVPLSKPSHCLELHQYTRPPTFQNNLDTLLQYI